jgi:hypothetical protein
MIYRKDILCKSIIEDFPEDLLRFYYPDADKIFDLSRGVVVMDMELPELVPHRGSRRGAKRTDKVLQVYTRTGQVVYVIIDTEFQGYHDPLFAERLFTYFYRLLDRFGKCVTALVIYTDWAAGSCPSSFDYAQLGTRLSFGFTPFKVWEQNEDELWRQFLENRLRYAYFNLVMLFNILYRKQENLLFEKSVQLVETLDSWEPAENKKHKMLNFIRLYFDFKNPDLTVKFDGIIQSFIKTDTMGIMELSREFAREDGRKEGRKEGRKLGEKSQRLKDARNFLQLGVDIDIISKATELSLKEIKNLRQVH